MSNINCGIHCLEKKWCVVPSIMSSRTINPVRRIVDQMKVEVNPEFRLISLSIGTLTVCAYNQGLFFKKN